MSALKSQSPLFQTITADHWRESIARARGERNLVREQITAMSEYLFPDDTIQMLSPRLRWMLEHKVYTEQSPCLEAGDEPWTAWFGIKDPLQFVEAHGLQEAGCGETEHDALVDLAVIQGWPLWNEL